MLFPKFRDLLLLGFRRPSRFSSLLAAGDVLRGRTSRKTSPMARSEEKRLFTQSNVGQIEVAFLNLLLKPDCNL